MPFSSKKQAKWAFATHQPWAKEWASKTNFKELPRTHRKAIRGLIKKYSKR